MASCSHVVGGEVEEECCMLWGDWRMEWEGQGDTVMGYGRHSPT